MERVGVVSVMAQKDEAIKIHHNNRWINTRPRKIRSCDGRGGGWYAHRIKSKDRKIVVALLRFTINI